MTAKKLKHKRIRNAIILAIIAAVLVFWFYPPLSFLANSSVSSSSSASLPENGYGASPNIPDSSTPKGNIHWHPKLTIRIDGKKISLPSDIGYGTGRIIDTHLSGMRMSPTHTHESDGTIHIENRNPSAKPETLTLGYFFYVWDETFSSTCIFEFCTDNGTLKLYVNGEENNEFESLIMRDGDDILIEYVSEGNVFGGEK